MICMSLVKKQYALCSQCEISPASTSCSAQVDSPSDQLEPQAPIGVMMMAATYPDPCAFDDMVDPQPRTRWTKGEGFR